MAEKRAEREFGVIVVAKRYSEPEPKPEGKVKRALRKARGLSEEDRKAIEFAKRLKEVMDEMGPTSA